MRILITCVLSLTLPFGAAARAEDIAAAYADAMAVYYPDGSAIPQGALLAGLNAIPPLEGSWVAASLMFPDGAYDAEIARKGCDRNAYVIAATGPFGFTLTRTRQAEPTPAVVTYTFAGGATYSRTADLNGFARFLFNDTPVAELPPGMILSTLTAPTLNGFAIVRLVSPDVLVIEAPTVPPEILTRCP